MTDDRPFDILDEYEEERVKVNLVDNKVVTGILRAFDQHQNLYLEDAMVYKTSMMKETDDSGETIVREGLEVTERHDTLFQRGSRVDFVTLDE